MTDDKDTYGVKRVYVTNDQSLACSFFFSHPLGDARGIRSCGFFSVVLDDVAICLDLLVRFVLAERTMYVVI